MRILVCGSRTYSNRDNIWKILSLLHEKYCKITEILHGGCSGADTFADGWAMHNGIKSTKFRAYWYRYGVAAGPMRNQEMVNTVPDMVLAFDARKRNGRKSGTMDCVERAIQAGIKVRIYP